MLTAVRSILLMLCIFRSWIVLKVYVLLLLDSKIAFRKGFSKFYCRQLIVKHGVGFKLLLQQGIPDTLFNGVSIYKFKSVVKESFFDFNFEIISLMTRLTI